MPILAVLLAATLWGLVGPVSRFALSDGLSGLEIAFWRAGIAAALFVLQALWVGRLWIRPRDLPGIAALGCLGVAGLEASNLLAVEAGGASLASILLYTAPGWVAVFSRLFFREELSGRKLLALAVSLAGVAGVASGGPGGGMSFTFAAVGWGLLSGLCYAAFYVFGKYYFERYDSRTVLAFAFPVGALVILPFVTFQPKSGGTWLAISFLGVPSTFVAYFLYSLGLKHLEPTRAAVLATLEPVVAAGVSFVLWKERLGGAGYLWALAVLAGVVMMVGAKPGQPGTDSVSSSSRR